MPDLSGQTFGQYQLIMPIGSGGMATVYKAYQPALDRIVAIKILPDYLIDQPGFLERFKIEAQAVAKLDHPHILPIYDYGQQGRVPYLVMKYVQGGTLKDLMKQGPLEPHRAANIIRQIAEALDHAHQQGIVHRDVKPGNVLIQEGDYVQLTDFGLAKMLDRVSEITASGVGVGTPDYMSPEQVQGEAVSGSSDIYSLGIILYQLLTGSAPFHAETPMAIMLKHLTERPSSVRAVNPTINEATDRVVQRALAKDPKDRYPSSTDLAEAYERSLDSGATLPRVIHFSGQQRRWTPWIIGGGTLIVVAAIVVLLTRFVPAAAPIPAPTSTLQPATAMSETITPPTAELASAAGLMGDTLFDDFSAAAINSDRWEYDGSYTATLNTPAVHVDNGRLIFDATNAAEDYYDGGLLANLDREFTLVAARVSLIDATGYSDIGLEVNGIDGDPNSWAYLAMNPTDATVSAYLGNADVTQQTFALVLGTGMPATHELAIGWQDGQIIFYVDGQPKKSLASSTRGQWIWLLFDVEPQGKLSGSFDDVRLTYAP